MARIIRNFWGQIWSKRNLKGKRARKQRLRDINTYLSFYNKTFPTSSDFNPSIPNVAEIEEGLKETNDSAHGIDGIPFSVYRCLSDIAAPLLREILLFISSGKLPPSDFNNGRLFIIPKDGSSTVDRTRPITVNNADNRIIAKLTTIALTPGLDHMLDSAQQGFIPGRSGDNHILDLNKFYYDAIRNRNPAFILLLDTAKAFDSIDHDFLFALINKINMPPWINNTITALFHDVNVFPVLDGPPTVSIQIHRGVKQGCPLSPLLFALAYDPLLSLLSAASCDPKAFADDLGIPADDIDTLLIAMPIIDAFAAISGLGLNIEKTHILIAHILRDIDKYKLSQAPASWRIVKFVYSATYLGILMGRYIDNHDIYAKAFTKFNNRIKSYSPLINHLPIQHKIIAANTFLTPVFSYLIQYYLIPERILKAVRNSLRRLIIGFNGTAFAYIHLTTPTTYFGFKQPLRDLWATMVSRLASHSKTLLDHDGKYIASIPDKRFLEEKSWASSHISDHRDSAALEYLNFHRTRPVAGHFAGLIFTHNLTSPATTPTIIRKTIYGDCVLRGMSSTRWSLTKEDPIAPSLAAKFKSYNFPAAAADQLFMAAEKILPSIPDCFRTQHIKMIFGGLATDSKMARKNMEPLRRGPDSNPYPCHFCGTGPDKSTHIFSACPVTTAARNAFHSKIGINGDTSIRFVSLASPAATQLKATNAVLIFNWHLWDLRIRVFEHPHKTFDLDQAVKIIADFALERWTALTPSSWWPSTCFNSTPPNPISYIPQLLWPCDDGSCLPDMPAPCYSKWLEMFTAECEDLEPADAAAALPAHHDPKSNPFGNSKSRTKTQKAAAKAEAERLVAAAPSNAILCFCDGSASPNPGPSGSGIIIYLPPHNNSSNRPTITASIPLGYGTNNIGELWGPLASLLLIKALPTMGHPIHTGPIHIYSDSRLTIDACSFSYHPTINKAIYFALRDIIINTTNTIHLHWVAGHAAIDQNELADAAAKSGMSISARAPGKSLAQELTPTHPLLPHSSYVRTYSPLLPIIDCDPFFLPNSPSSISLFPTIPPSPPQTPPSPIPLPPPPPPAQLPPEPDPPPDNHHQNTTYDQMRNENYASLLLDHPDTPVWILWERATPVLGKRRR
jgi:ribonuclease HI